jgi:hypothetical protein
VARGLAWAGLTARGVIYILIGFVAVAVAVGRSGREVDQQGAIQLLAGKPYGMVALWLLGIGFVGYALWRLSEAAFGVAGEGTGAGPRLKSLDRAVAYASFAVLVFKAISGAHSSQSREQQDVTAKVMQYPAGQWLVGLAGLIVVAIGVGAPSGWAARSGQSPAAWSSRWPASWSSTRLLRTTHRSRAASTKPC